MKYPKKKPSNKELRELVRLAKEPKHRLVYQRPPMGEKAHKSIDEALERHLKGNTIL